MSLEQQLFFQQLFFAIGALFALIAFIGGALGSHLFRNRFSEERRMTFEIALRYHMIHAFALFIISLSLELFPSTFLVLAGWSFIIGTVIFAGSLYLSTLSGAKEWGAITPIGGIILFLGWLFLLLGSLFAFKLF